MVSREIKKKDDSGKPWENLTEDRGPQNPSKSNGVKHQISWERQTVTQQADLQGEKRVTRVMEAVWKNQHLLSGNLYTLCEPVRFLMDKMSLSYLRVYRCKCHLVCKSFTFRYVYNTVHLLPFSGILFKLCLAPSQFTLGFRLRHEWKPPLSISRTGQWELKQHDPFQ